MTLSLIPNNTCVCACVRVCVCVCVCVHARVYTCNRQIIVKFVLTEAVYGSNSHSMLLNNNYLKTKLATQHQVKQLSTSLVDREATWENSVNIVSQLIIRRVLLATGSNA